MKEIASALVKAQRNRSTPEGRAQEGALIKALLGPLDRRNHVNGGAPMDRFMRGVAFGASECWYWRGSINRLGYGVLPAMGESKAHRVAYRLFKGEIPDGMLVMHTCDTRCCVNPEHLVVGTQADNMRDMASKGRGHSKGCQGSRNPMAKLTEEKVAEIRLRKRDGAKQIELAREFCVSPMTISRVVRGELWK